MEEADTAIRFHKGIMIDAMYEKEKPFIILDDPFINLDDEKLACAQQFVNAIAEHCQVIYLTCHNSRVIAL